MTNRHRKIFYWSLEKGDLLPVLLMVPAIGLVGFAMVVPLFYGAFLTLFDYRFGTFNPVESFVGLANYVRFFSDKTALQSVVNTLAFSAGAIAGDFIIGTAMALLLHSLASWASRWLRPIVTMPLLVSPIIVGLTWRYIYDPQGLLYWLLDKVKIPFEAFPGVTSASTALISIVIAHWWQVVPFVVIVLTAGLVSIPEELYEAAHVEGAGPFTVFRRITLPLLRDVYLVILLISGVDTIKIFDLIFALTGGGPNNSTVSLSIYAYNQGFGNGELSYAMTISVMAMLITFMVFGLPFIRQNSRRASEEGK